MIIKDHEEEADFLRRIGPDYARVFGRRLLGTRSPGDGDAPVLALRLTVEMDGILAGWHFGESPDGRVYRMTNSAVLPEFRRRGVYGLLCDELTRRLISRGIRMLVSRHRPGNEAILAAKRKQGFAPIGSVDDPRFGSLIEMGRRIG